MHLTGLHTPHKDGRYVGQQHIVLPPPPFLLLLFSIISLFYYYYSLYIILNIKYECFSRVKNKAKT